MNFKMGQSHPRLRYQITDEIAKRIKIHRQKSGESAPIARRGNVRGNLKLERDSHAVSASAGDNHNSMTIVDNWI